MSVIFVNVLDYGASPSATPAANAAAFLAAMQACPRVYFPDGTTFQTQNVEVPTSVAELFGAATLVGAGTLSSNVGVLDIQNNAAKLRVGDLILQGGASTPGLTATNCSDLVLDHVTAQGEYGISITGGSRITARNCFVPSYSLLGIIVNGVNDLDIDGCVVTAQGGTSHGIGIGNCLFSKVRGCRVSGCGGFGISVSGNGPPSQCFAVTYNEVTSTLVEGINIESSQQGQVSGNVIMFDPSTTLDFGLSLYGTTQLPTLDVVVLGNVIYYPHKSGIAFAEVVQRCSAVGNYIFNPNQGHGSADEFTSAVLMYGGQCQLNAVHGNHVFDADGFMKWQANESGAVSSTGAPNYNSFGPNFGSSGSAGHTNIVGTGSSLLPFAPQLGPAHN
jgi:hypothetical protein